MSRDISSENTLMRFLLGQASEEERSQIEQRFLGDGDYYEQLLIVEDELRCAYANGSLTAADREQFEKRFMPFPDERPRVELARDMLSELSGVIVESTPELQVNKERHGPWTRLGPLFSFKIPVVGSATAAAALFLVVAGLWLLLETSQLRHQVADLEARRTAREQEIERQSAEEHARVEQLNRELDEERKSRALLEQELAQEREQPAVGASVQPAILSLLLTPGRVRSGGETRKLVIETEPAQVRLLLDTRGEGTYKSYHATILNADGAQVLSRGGLRASEARGTRFVIVRIPARLLAEDDYQVTVKGLTEAGDLERIGDYYFTVNKPR
jgi:hypothetical protein